MVYKLSSLSRIQQIKKQIDMSRWLTDVQIDAASVLLLYTNIKVWGLGMALGLGHAFAFLNLQ